MKRLLIFLLIISLSSNTWAQTKPNIKGGLQAFAQSKLIYPLYAKDNCIQGTVELAFKLNAKGILTYASIKKSVGADLDNEALRILRLSSGKWTVPNGFDTQTIIYSAIKFSLEDFGCESQNPAGQGLALQQYQSQREGYNKIVNYFKEIELGRVPKANLQSIKQLKENLGIDEIYINRKIAIAERKLKQGDKKGACDDFLEIKYLGSAKGETLLNKYCK